VGKYARTFFYLLMLGMNGLRVITLNLAKNGGILYTVTKRVWRKY
jgi:hypothetical protein